MHNKNALEGFERLFEFLKNNAFTKAIQFGHLFNGVNWKALNTNANYYKVYKRIITNHYTNADKLKMLRAIVNNTSGNQNAIIQALKSVDMNQVERDPNYANLYNKAANKAGINLPVRIRHQQGPTCWFHAIVNGLLLSARPRRLLRRMVTNVPAANFSANACPSHKAGREWFLKYIKHRLEGRGRVHNAFKNASVIRATGMRGLGKPGKAHYSLASVAGTLAGGYTGGNVSDLIWFYNQMFPGQFTARNGPSTPLFVMRKFGKLTGQSNPAVPHTLVRNGIEYELTHSWIIFKVNFIISHVITGFKTAGGVYKAYDSNFEFTVPGYDWTKAAPITLAPNWYRNRYKPRGLLIYAIYMKAGV